MTLGVGAPTELRATLRPVLPPAWIAADLHLHSSPSPDSRVTLAQRVGSLVCNGIDFAVATDHNRITDLSPAVRAAGLDHALVTAMATRSPARALHSGPFQRLPAAPPVGEAVAPEDAVRPTTASTLGLFAGGSRPRGRPSSR